MTIMALMAFGAFWATQLVKTVLPWPLQPWTKQLIALVSAMGLGAMFDLGPPDWVISGVAASGFAAFIHKAHRWFGAMGDEARVSVITKAGRRPRI